MGTPRASSLTAADVGALQPLQRNLAALLKAHVCNFLLAATVILQQAERSVQHHVVFLRAHTLKVGFVTESRPEDAVLQAGRTAPVLHVGV